MHGGRELVFQEPEAADKDQENGSGDRRPERTSHRVTHRTGDKEARTEGSAIEDEQEEHAGQESRPSRVSKARR